MTYGMSNAIGYETGIVENWSDGDDDEVQSLVVYDKAHHIFRREPTQAQ